MTDKAETIQTAEDMVHPHDADWTNDSSAPADEPSRASAHDVDENATLADDERPDHVPEAEEPFDFERATITVQLKLLPRADGAASRLALVSATSHDQPPSRIIGVAAADISLHPEITRLLADLAAEMPAKRARRRQELAALETAAAGAKEEKERRAAEVKRKSEEARSKTRTKTATSAQSKGHPVTSTEPRKLDTLPPLPPAAELETARRGSAPRQNAASVTQETAGSETNVQQSVEAPCPVALPKTSPLAPLKVSTPTLFD